MLEDKVTLITGASQGLGRALALAFAREGARMAINARSQESIGPVAEEVEDTGAEVLALAADVSKGADVERMVDETVQRFGKIDVLVNNAGLLGPRVRIVEYPEDEWRNVIDANLTGPFLCTQEAMKIMKDQSPRGGRIINNGSISAHAPRPFSVAYTSTKHAITGLTKSTSLDGRQYDIACGQIDIGNAVTPMTERMTKGVLQPNGTTVAEPRMDVSAVANAIVYMDSLPLDANVQFMTVMATKMPFVGRG